MTHRDPHSGQHKATPTPRGEAEHAPSKPERLHSAPDGNTSSPGEEKSHPSPKKSQFSVNSTQKLTESDATSPQLQPHDRVEDSMATLALDPVKPAEQTPREAGPAHSATAHDAELDSDSVVMLRVRDGDDAAFSFLVEKYHRPMIHYMYRMTHNQAIAEELAQEVFLRVYRSRESYRAEARFSTWLYRIATNLGVNHARDTRHERTAHTVYLDERDPETGTTPDVPDGSPSAEQDLVREERMKAIRRHVMALPERQRNAVLMHKYQGLDYRQIGEVLKLSESATKSLLFRAYQTLRERLKEFVEEN
jgi:RNA polymerase sigma-70 factor (ECF subfamily)